MHKIAVNDNKETGRMLSQPLNGAMLHSCNQLEEGANRKEIIFCCSL